MERVRELGAALAEVRAPFFLARMAAFPRREMRLHTMDRGSAALLRKQAEKALREHGLSIRCSVVCHRPAALARRKSLQALDSAFGKGETVFDPTRAVSRAAALAELAGSLRGLLDGRIHGIFVDAQRRALFVTLDRSGFPDAGDALLQARVAAMNQLGNAINAWRAARADRMELSVRIGFALPPQANLTPVDRRSERFARPSRSFFDRLRTRGVAATVASLVGIGGSAAQAVAADVMSKSQDGLTVPPVHGPAVAAPNLEAFAVGGWLDGAGFNNQAWGAAGIAATAPIGNRFGAQFDAAFGSDGYYGVGGHLFWRDPMVGLLGVVGSYESANTGSLSRVAVEGEIYRGDLTLRGTVGAETGISKGAFGKLDLTFYATPNLALTVGGEFGDRSLGVARVEWQPGFGAIPGLSLFADGEIGTGGYARVLAGVNFHFGSNGVSLKERDRNYDPTFSLLNTQQINKKKGYINPK